MNELRSAQPESTVTETVTEAVTGSVTEAVIDADAEALPSEVIEAEDLLEEISIDGMCGVY
ncbi:mycofactocin precursor MftA [Streptomyces zaehneri]|uniref:mycofactocin precursor MftA n=1 Tax=Streptomyces zaehneri TaxID=3051180 RepID=UPI0028D8B707|nr:mycofactocin precursor MftA [Streptomyces sp. DSM 40713]